MRVRVPATSANLGPGYDAFGLALDLHNEFEGELSAEWSVLVTGEGAGRLSTGPDNQVARAAARAFAEAGMPDARVRITCRNAIPVGRGLGSSSAAIVGGLLLGFALAGHEPPPERVLALAAELEGHADNVAAALLGGFVVSAGPPDALRVRRFEPARGLAVVVVLGQRELKTVEARSALPAVVPHGEAAANAANAALVALGIVRGDGEALAFGAHDALHERYRAHLVPDLDEVRTVLVGAGATNAVLSGAGPSVVALVTGSDDARALEDARAIADAARSGLAAIGRQTVFALGVDRAGARVL